MEALWQKTNLHNFFILRAYLINYGMINTKVLSNLLLTLDKGRWLNVKTFRHDRTYFIYA